MPLPRFAKLEPERQAEILRVAREHFAEAGFEGASYNKIIEGIGLSKGAMYYYFADKLDLYESVIDGVLDELQKAAQALAPPLPNEPEAFWSMLSNTATVVRGRAEADPAVRSLGRDLFASAAGLERVSSRARGWVASLIAHGQTVGAVRVDVATDVLAHATVGLILALDRLVLLESRDELDAATIISLCRDLLLPRQPERS